MNTYNAPLKDMKFVMFDLLQAEQNNWMAIREEAARRSPRAVAALYDQRIEQLNAMARGPGPDW